MERKRHILDWLNSIADEKIRKEAIANYEPYYCEDPLSPENVNDAIGLMCDWENTPQQGLYWADVQQSQIELREVPDGDWHSIDGVWVNMNDLSTDELAERRGMNAKPSVHESMCFGGKSHDHDFDKLSWSDEGAIQHAIDFLKSKGYKVMKPVTQFEEV